MLAGVATLERPVDRGTRLGRAALARIGAELRDARIARGLSLARAADAAGISASELSRIERGLSQRVPLLTLTRCAAVVGLDLNVRLFAGGHPLRDASQITLLGELRVQLHVSLVWATEVPMPTHGDQRAWDATIRGRGWTFGVEAETAPRDLQAVARRVHLKLRDSGFEGVILLVRDTRRVRELLHAEAAALGEVFPVSSRRALAALRAGIQPPGNAIILLPVRIRHPDPAEPAATSTHAVGRRKTTTSIESRRPSTAQSADSGRSVPPGG
jgi:transcriptional regulator with XRE-family HTH domain